MTLFLTSSPCVIGAKRAILNPENGLVDQLKESLPRHPRTLFVCADAFDHDQTDAFAETFAAAFKEAGMELGVYKTLDSRNGYQAQLLIWQSDLIILSGGHVPTQNEFFRLIGLKELISNYMGVVLGISAGSMNCAARVYAQPEAPGESRPDFQRFLPGLGLTKINILPHYQQAKDYTLDGKHLYEEVTLVDSMGENFLALVDGSYLVVADGTTYLYGQAYSVADGEIIRISSPGDVMLME